MPPEARSDKGPGDTAEAAKHHPARPGKDVNTAEQGRQGNAHQNTTHPGQQQDR